MTLDYEALRRTQVPITDDAVRVWLRGYDEACDAGPSMRDDYLAATCAAMGEARRRSWEFTPEEYSEILGLSLLLSQTLGLDDRRATLLAKEHVVGSPRRAMVEVVAQYHELIAFEAEQRRRRKNPTITERAFDAVRREDEFDSEPPPEISLTDAPVEAEPEPANLFAESATAPVFPITITTPDEVPEAVRLAQARRHRQ